MKKEKIERRYGYLIVDDKYYELSTEGSVTSFIEVNKKKVKKKIKLMQEISDKLKESLDKEAVLMEALSDLDEEYLEMIHNNLYNSKRKVKPVTRKHHCVDMKVGKLIIPIVN